MGPIQGGPPPGMPGVPQSPVAGGPAPAPNRGLGPMNASNAQVGPNRQVPAFGGQAAPAPQQQPVQPNQQGSHSSDTQIILQEASSDPAWAALARLLHIM